MIEIKNLDFGYGGTRLIQNVSLTIPAGGITALVGPNGAGKSTLLRLIARLLTPQRGQVQVEGRDMHDAPPDELARLLSILPQRSFIAPRLTVRELVAFGRYPYHKGRATAQDHAIIDKTLTQFEIEPLADRMLDSLSGGQHQRALVAMTYAQDTKYMLLDEPLNNLDIAASRSLMRTLDDLAKTHDKTIVIVLHDLNFACGYADRILAMANGAVQAFGTPQEIITEAFLSDVFGTNAKVAHLEGRPFVVV